MKNGDNKFVLTTNVYNVKYIFYYLLFTGEVYFLHSIFFKSVGAGSKMLINNESYQVINTHIDIFYC